jgi:hypothetical protein
VKNGGRIISGQKRRRVSAKIIKKKEKRSKREKERNRKM